MTCECCNQDKPIVGVACIPFMPISVAWCADCLKSGAIPYWSAVANTACCGGLDNTNEAWKELVDITLKYHNKTKEEFEKDVLADLEELS